MNKVLINKYIMVKDYIYKDKKIEDFKNTFSSTVVEKLQYNNIEVEISDKDINIDIDYNGKPRFNSIISNLICMKPTFGAVSRFGIINDTSSLLQVSISTKDVDNNKKILNIISGKDEKDLMTYEKRLEKSNKDIDEIFIAVPSYYKNTLDKTFDDFKVEYVDIKYFEYISVLYKIIYNVESSSNLSKYDGIKYGFNTRIDYKNTDDYYKLIRNEIFDLNEKISIIFGNYLLLENENYLKSLYLRNKFIEELKNILSKYDFIISPILFEKDSMLLVPNITGFPALTINNFQIIGNRYKEMDIYDLASYIYKRGVNNE